MTTPPRLSPLAALALLGALASGACGEGSASDTGQVATSTGGSAGGGQGGSGQSGSGQGGAGQAGKSGGLGQGGSGGQGGAGISGSSGQAGVTGGVLCPPPSVSSSSLEGKPCQVYPPKAQCLVQGELCACGGFAFDRVACVDDTWQKTHDGACPVCPAGGASGAGGSTQGGQAGSSGQGGAAGGGSGQGGGGAAAGQGGAGSGGGAGGGGAGQGGVGGSAGGGGSGGAPLVPCKTLVKIGMPFAIGDDDHTLSYPKLAAMDAKQVALAAARLPKSPEEPSSVQFSAIEPWSVWPPIATAQGLELGAEGASVVVSGSEGLLDGLLRSSSEPLLVRWVHPLLPINSPNGVALPIEGADWPYFLLPLGQYQLAGVESGGQARAYVLDTLGFTAKQTEGVLGCGQGELSFDAAALPGGGALVASSSWSLPAGCGTDGPQGPRTRVLLHRHDLKAADLVAELDMGVTVTDIRLFARSDGAWLVYRLDDAGVPGPLTARRLDGSGKPVGDPVPLPGMWGDWPGFGKQPVARLGDRLIVMGRDDGGQITKLMVYVVGDDGVSLPLMFSANAMHGVLLGAPSADRLLAGWEEPGFAPQNGILLQRVDCAEEAQ